jgi:hypothetical protein
MFIPGGHGTSRRMYTCCGMFSGKNTLDRRLATFAKQRYSMYMKDPQLHHSAYRIVPESFEKVIEIFGLLGCRITFRDGDARWAMIGQDGVSFDIQLIEMDEAPIQSTTRISSHIAFISHNPKEIIDKIEKWASKSDVKFVRGSWNEQMLWFDLPELFVDFVVEVMNRSVVEQN